MAVTGKGRGALKSTWISSGQGLRKQTAWPSDNLGQRTALLDWYLGIASTAVDGTLASTLGGATQVASGAEAFSGAFASALTGVTQVSVGSELFSGGMAALLDAATMSANGASEVTGVLVIELVGATMYASGSIMRAVGGGEDRLRRRGL